MVKDPKPDIREDSERATPTRKSSVAGWALAAVVVLLLVFGAISYFSNPHSPEEAPDRPASTGEAQPGATGNPQ